jgi:hypothetical protein
MNPSATRGLSMGVKAATRGTQRHQRQFIRAAGGSTARFLTLPPGSVRSYPFRDQVFDGRDQSDDDQVLESTPRMQMSMSPPSSGVRRYGTATSFDVPEYDGTWSSSLQHFPSQASYDEEYDQWNVHGTPVDCATTSDLGTQTTGFDPIRDIQAANPFMFENTYQSEEYSSTYQAEEDYVEFEEGFRILHDDAGPVDDDGDDSSLDF